MLCPFCREKDTSVVDSRPTEDGTAIRRRRLCGCEEKRDLQHLNVFNFKNLQLLKVMVKENHLIEIKFQNQ